MFVVPPFISVDTILVPVIPTLVNGLSLLFVFKSNSALIILFSTAFVLVADSVVSTILVSADKDDSCCDRHHLRRTLL